MGKVTASIDTTHFKGRISKGVAVTTNDSANGTFMLQLSAEVVPAFALAPTESPKLDGKAADLKPVELTLTSSDRKPFDILRVDADPKLAVSVKPTAGKAPRHGKNKGKRKRGDDAPAPVAEGSNSYAVTIAVKPDAPVGRAVAVAMLSTSHPRVQSVPIRVSLALLGALQVEPERLVVQPAQATTAQHVKIRKLEGQGLAIIGVESSDPDFTTMLATVVEGREYDLAVQYTGKPGRGVVSTHITVKTNEPTQGTIVIPVRGRV